MVVMMLLIASMFLMVAYSPMASAAVTTGTTSNVVPSGSRYIRDDSTAVPVIGFGATSNVNTDRLSRVEITFDTFFNGLTTGEFEGLSTNSEASGVALVRDDGDVDDAFDVNDTAVDVSSVAWIAAGLYDTARLDLNAAIDERVPGPASPISGSYHWFIVIRTDWDIDDSDTVEGWIYADDIQFSDGSSQPGSTTSFYTLDVRESRYYDRGDGWMRASEADNLLGFNIVDGGPYEKFDRVSVRFLNLGGFTQSDLMPITTSASASGVAIYRNDGDTVWDAGDSPVDCTSVDTRFWPTVYLYPDDEDVPDTPSSYGYWIIVRTSATAGHNNRFYVYGDTSSLRINGTLDNNWDRLQYTPESGNNDYEDTRIDDYTPWVSSISWTEWSQYLHYTGGTMWFGSTMTWTQTATLRANVVESGSGVYRTLFSYEPSLASGGYNDYSSPYEYTYSFDSWDDDTSNPITLTMTDNAGNVGAYDVTYAEDNTPPTVAILQPIDTDTVSGVVTIQVSASDAQSGLRYSSAVLYVNGMWTGTLAYDGTHFTGNWDSSTYTDGGYRLVVQLYDEVNNVGSDFVNVFSDNTGPSSIIYYPTMNQYVNADADLIVIAATSDFSPVTSAEVQIDSGGWMAMNYDSINGTWSINLGLPGAGTHTIEMRATDSEGNMGPTTSVTVYGDGDDPTVDIVSLSSGDEKSGTINIQVNATDAQSLDTVTVYLVQGTTTYTLPATFNPVTGYYEVSVDTTGLADGAWSIAAVAWDQAGRYNISTPFIFTVDNTEPTLSIDTPTEGTYVYGSYTITATATDSGSGFDSGGCALSIDGGAWVAMTNAGGGSFTYDLDTTSLADGAHTLNVAAVDDAGNIVVRTVRFVVDNTQPVVSVVSPSSGDYVEGTYTFAVSAIDNLGVAAVTAQLTGPTTSMNVTLGFNAASGYWEWTSDTAAWEEGSWTIQPFAFELSGRLYTGAASVAFFVDNSNPWMQITAPTDGEVILSNSYSISVSATDGPFTIPTLIYRVDMGNWASLTAGAGNVWTTTWDTTAVVDGEHTLTFAAIDNAGHVTIEMVTVTVDNTDPTCMVALPSDGEYLEGIETFGIQAADSLGVDSVDITFTGISGLGTVGATFNPGSGYWEFVLDTTTVTDADGSLIATATDSSGRSTVAASVAFRIDNNVPTLVVDTPMDGQVILNETYDVVVQADDVTFGLNPGDVEWRVDANPWSDMLADTNGWTVGWFTSDFADGAHTLSFRVTDAVGHVSQSSIDVVVDNTDPVVSLNTPSINEFVGGVYTFSARAADSLGVSSVAMDFGWSGPAPFTSADATFNPSTGYWELTVDSATLPDGPATLALTATDTSGRQTTTMVYDFAVDNNAPTFLLLSPSPGEIVLDDTVSVLVNASDVGFTLTVGDVEYNLDGTGWIAMENISGEATLWGLDIDTTVLTDGEHDVAFRVTDAAGHVTTGDVVFTVDLTDPTASIVSPVTGEFAMGVYVFRVAATDSLGIDQVELTFTGISSMTSAMGTYNPASGMWEFLIDTTTLDDAEVTVSAIATDTSGRSSMLAGPVDFTIDNNAPIVAFVNPTEGQILTEGQHTVDVTAIDSFFEVEYGMVRISMDGGSWIVMDKVGGEFTYDWNTTSLSDGEHNLMVMAEDKAGHVASASINVIVDNHVPALAIVSPTDGQFVTGSMTFQVASSDARGVTSVSLSWEEDQTFFATVNTATNYYEYGLDTTTLVDGTYTLTAISIDGSGLMTQATVDFHVDNTEPQLEFSGPLSGSILDGEVTVTATATDTFIDTLQFSVDGVGWVDMVDGAGTFDSTAFSDGDHTITVRAIDGSGKVVSAESEVTIDNNAPVISVADYPAMGEHLAGDRLFATFSDDTVGVVAVTVTIRGEEMPVYINPATGFYEWMFSSTNYNDSVVDMTFTAFDAAGNNSTIEWTVEVDNSAPVILEQSPKDGSEVKEIVHFEVSATDATGVESVLLRIGHGPWITMTLQDDGTYLYKWETTTEEDQEGLEYTIRVTDDLGNSEDTVSTIDVNNPMSMAWIALIVILGVLVFLGFFFMRKRDQDMETEAEPSDELEEISADYDELVGLDASAEAPAGENGMPSSEDLADEVAVEIEEL
jgi:hypothetical protein